MSLITAAFPGSWNTARQVVGTQGYSQNEGTSSGFLRVGSPFGASVEPWTSAPLIALVIPAHRHHECPCLPALPTVPGWALFSPSILTPRGEPPGRERPLWAGSAAAPDLGGSISLPTTGKGPLAPFLYNQCHLTRSRGWQRNGNPWCRVHLRSSRAG